MRDYASDGGKVGYRGISATQIDTATYFAAKGITGFYPEIVVAFEVTGTATKYHVPLLLSPYAYSTYRGS